METSLRSTSRYEILAVPQNTMTDLTTSYGFNAFTKTGEMVNLTFHKFPDLKRFLIFKFENGFGLVPRPLIL